MAAYISDCRSLIPVEMERGAVNARGAKRAERRARIDASIFLPGGVASLRRLGMDFVDPPIDSAALARSLGMRAHRIDTGDEFGAAYRDALAAREPVLLEVIVDGSV
jgi:Thiamine pyrophosphate enzyme, C-terminal TPP binding domain